MVKRELTNAVEAKNDLTNKVTVMVRTKQANQVTEVSVQKERTNPMQKGGYKAVPLMMNESKSLIVQ